MYRNKLFKFLFIVLTLENYYIYPSKSKNTSYNFVTSLLSDSNLIRITRICISVPYLHVWRHCVGTKWRKIFCSLNQLLTLLTIVKPWLLFLVVLFIFCGLSDDSSAILCTNCYMYDFFFIYVVYTLIQDNLQVAASVSRTSVSSGTRS